MDQRRLINLNRDKCARMASEHRKEVWETAPGANRLNVADKNPHVEILTDKGRNITSSPSAAQATVWLLGHTSAEEKLWGLSQWTETGDREGKHEDKRLITIQAPSTSLERAPARSQQAELELTPSSASGHVGFPWMTGGKGIKRNGIWWH